MAVMPMFPLSTVLLPNMPLTLRIFEERYLKLLGQLLEEDEPEFGVVIIHEGQEVGGGPGSGEGVFEKRGIFGTIAQVIEVKTDEQFYGLVATGGERFRVNAWLPDDPYPLADIDFLPDLTWDASLAPLFETVEAKVRRFLSMASEFGDLEWQADIELSDDPMAACWQLAGIMPLDPAEKYQMLQSESAEELLHKIEKAGW